MSEELQTYHGQPLPQAIEMLLMGGDLTALSAEHRIQYYMQVCQSLGLNHLTQPFGFLELDKKVVLYAKKDCAEQLRNIRGVSIEIVGEKTLNSGVYIVTAKATMPDGRFDTATGAVPLNREDGQWKTSSNGKRFFEGNGKMVPLHGDQLANAYMKAETKAKRRVTLSICGLGMIDESEIDSIAGARRVAVDMRTGEIQQPKEIEEQANGRLVRDEGRKISDSSDAAPNGRGSVEDVMDGPSKASPVAETVAGAPEGDAKFCTFDEANELMETAMKLGWTLDEWNRAMVELGIPSEEQIPKAWYLKVKNFVASNKNMKRIRAEQEAAQS